VIRTEIEFSSRRIYRIIAVLALAGTIAAVVLGGAAAGIGFMTGAVFSAVNFWFWHRMVQRIGQTPSDGEEPRKSPIILFGIRYFLFVGGVYATILYFEASVTAALTGIFVAVAAVLLEILFELFYGTTS